MLLKRAALLVVFLLLYGSVVGCSPSSIPTDTLLAAPQEVKIAGQRYVLETYLSRDFKPGSPPEGAPLTALVWVRALVPPPSLPPLEADRLWVIKGAEVWEADLQGKTLPYLPEEDSVLGKTAEGGPKWAVGSRVEVIIRLLDEKGHAYLLRASEQEIYAVR